MIINNYRLLLNKEILSQCDQCILKANISEENNYLNKSINEVHWKLLILFNKLTEIVYKWTDNNLKQQACDIRGLKSD